jgi:hypothetical protein
LACDRFKGLFVFASDKARRFGWGWGPRLAVAVMVLSLVNCDFTASAQLKKQDQPPAGQPAKAEGQIFGRVLSSAGAIGPQGAPEPTGVAGQPVEIIDPQSGQTIAQATSGPDGSFRISVRPGNYLLQAVGSKRYVRVEAGQEQQVNVMLATP